MRAGGSPHSGECGYGRNRLAGRLTVLLAATGLVRSLSGLFMRTQVRIVAGSLRGRRLTIQVNPNLRPTPQRVREALFSLLGNAVPERPFFDVFAGTGVNGMEALSRGASSVTFVERDFRLMAEVDRYLRDFGVQDRAVLARADVYRWVERWQTPAEPVNVFISPPFADFENRLDDSL